MLMVSRARIVTPCLEFLHGDKNVHISQRTDSKICISYLLGTQIIMSSEGSNRLKIVLPAQIWYAMFS